MKNKKLLYILIPGTLLVWGLIIYKIVMRQGGDENTSFQTMDNQQVKSTFVFNDTFSINPTYRDPFTGNQVKKVISSSQPTLKKIISPPIIASWPQITYGGIVKNQKSNKQLVLVSVNGQSTMLKVGESFNNIELTKVFKDSIEVKLGKDKRYIKK